MTKPSKELTQEINAGHAEKALEAHADSIGVDYQRNMAAITDMLTTLRHYSDVHGLSFFQALDMSYEHYLSDLKDTAA